MVIIYNNGWEFERDLFLFDTVVFPFFKQMGFSLRKSISWAKKENKEYYEVLFRLSKDDAGKIYIKGAYKNPENFERTVNKKYEGRSLEKIQRDNNWYL